MATQAGGLKKANNNNINAIKNTVQNKTWADNKLKQMAYMNLSYTHIISYTQYVVHSIIMYTMLNQEITVSSRLYNNIPANIFLPRF